MAAAAAVASLILAIGSSIDGHLLFVLGLPLTAAAFLLACLAARARDEVWPWRRGTFALWLAAAAAVGIVGSATHGRVWYEVARRLFFVGGVVITGWYASGDRVWQRRGVWTAVGLATCLYIVTPLGTPSPMIDVFAWNQTAAHALLHGVHPYTVIAPDVYRGGFDPGFHVSVYPYTPALPLLYAPWVAATGDFRFALAACLPLTIALVHAASRRLHTDPDLRDGVVLALALNPSGPRIVASGWTEPLLVLGLAAFVYCASRKRGAFGAAAAFLLLPALKQYVVAPVLMFLDGARRRGRLRIAVAAAILPAATVLPFAIWNARATLAGIVVQMAAPISPRLDATSVTSWLAASSWPYPDKWLSVVVQIVAAAIAWTTLKDKGTRGLLLASAISLSATFLVAWQAFVNYYYFVAALLLFVALEPAAAEAAGA